MLQILVTGGCGYIGSHTVLALVEANYDVVVVDNLSNSSEEPLRRIETMTGKKVTFYNEDIRDREKMYEIFSAHNIAHVIHFAGLKAVGESVQNPLAYYDVNVGGTVSLLSAMSAAGLTSIIFSSSATVYRPSAEKKQLKEGDPVGQISSPYGSTKMTIETILHELCSADVRWRAVILRYFNPIGAHASGRIGEDPRGIPNNLMPYIAQVAVGRRSHLTIFGTDYDTPDGTAVRDYIHVVDLARGHLAALRLLQKERDEEMGLLRCSTFNLGTGRGYSVMDVVRAFGEASGIAIPYKMGARRAGDLPYLVADASLAAEKNELDWRADFDLSQMCRDHWRWQQANPQGYD